MRVAYGFAAFVIGILLIGLTTTLKQKFYPELPVTPAEKEFNHLSSEEKTEVVLSRIAQTPTCTPECAIRSFFTSGHHHLVTKILFTRLPWQGSNVCSVYGAFHEEYGKRIACESADVFTRVKYEQKDLELNGEIKTHTWLLLPHGATRISRPGLKITYSYINLYGGIRFPDNETVEKKVMQLAERLPIFMR